MHPTWRGDSKELFFLTPDKKLVAADVPARMPHVDEPHTLFQTRITGVARNHYTVSADGQRFLINSPISDPAIRPITVVLNWPALLTLKGLRPTASRVAPADVVCQTVDCPHRSGTQAWLDIPGDRQ